ncbi:hypothetical protein V8C86DRAFT_3028675 [Haematococcus lacustris]
MLEAVMGSDPATEPPVSVSGGVKTTVTKRGQKAMADDEDGLDEEEREAEEIDIVRNTPGLMSKDYNSVAGHQALKAMGAKKRKTEEASVDFAAVMSKNMEALKHTGLLSSATKRLTSLSKNLQCMRHLLIKATDPTTKADLRETINKMEKQEEKLQEQDDKEQQQERQQRERQQRQQQERRQDLLERDQQLQQMREQQKELQQLREQQKELQLLREQQNQLSPLPQQQQRSVWLAELMEAHGAELPLHGRMPCCRFQLIGAERCMDAF